MVSVLAGVVGNGARRAYRLFLVRWRIINGSVAQLGERLICIQDVAGSTPVRSTKLEGWQSLVYCTGLENQRG